MIDLHLHTRYSDGMDSVTQLLEKAQEKGLSLISITDHNTVGAYFELARLDSRKYFRGKIIPGIEISCIYFGGYIEILGYGIDIDKINKSKVIVNQARRDIQLAEFAHIKRSARSAGFVFDDNTVMTDNDVWANSVYSHEIYRHKENMELLAKHGFDPDNRASLLRIAQGNTKNIFYVPTSLPSAQTIIDEIHDAGGLAFFAHPFMYEFPNKEEVIERFISEHNIDGVECYYSLFSDEQTDKLLSLCNKYNKLISGGSDSHGDFTPNRKMGFRDFSRDCEWVKKMDGYVKNIR